MHGAGASHGVGRGIGGYASMMSSTQRRLTDEDEPKYNILITQPKRHFSGASADSLGTSSDRHFCPKLKYSPKLRTNIGEYRYMILINRPKWDII